MKSDDLQCLQDLLQQYLKTKIDSPERNFTLTKKILSIVDKIDYDRRIVWNNEKFGEYENIVDTIYHFNKDIIMNSDLEKLNCMNYQIHDSEGEYWYAQCGLRSLYEYSKITSVSFKAICRELLKSGQIIVPDIRDIDNDTLCITMI